MAAGWGAGVPGAMEGLGEVDREVGLGAVRGAGSGEAREEAPGVDLVGEG